MISALLQVLSYLLVISVLVTVHEFGHFWVARRLGFKVLRFSIGFGRPVVTRIGHDGTEFVLSAIPLGGYVRLADEREVPFVQRAHRRDEADARALRGEVLDDRRADAGAAALMGRKQPMVNALTRLQHMQSEGLPPSLQAMGISGGLGKMFSSHPPLEERIAALQTS